MEDPNLTTFVTTYYAGDALASEVVEGHNDDPTPSDEDALHYTVWRYKPNGCRVTAFRCRYKDWVATAAPRDVAPTRDELAERDALRERADVADLRAAEAEQRAAQLAQRVEELDGQLKARQAPPEPDDVPF